MVGGGRVFVGLSPYSLDFDGLGDGKSAANHSRISLARFHHRRLFAVLSSGLLRLLFD
jgi:hypothetical protein